MFNPPAAVQESVVKKMGHSLPFLKIIGTLEVLGGLGLILPALTRVMPLLSPVAARRRNSLETERHTQEIWAAIRQRHGADSQKRSATLELDAQRF